MRSPSLKRLSVLHHRFYTIGFVCSCKSFAWRFQPANYRHRHHFFREISINFHHLFCFCFRFFLGSVSSVPFLPKKFRSTKERARSHLPSNHICPLVYKYRKVSIRLNPVFISIPNNSLRSRSYDKLFLQFCFWIYDKFWWIFWVCFQTIVRNYSTFFSKSLCVFFFCFEQTFRNENREIGVLVSCLLKSSVELISHLFPNGVSIRLDNHTAANTWVLR